MKLADFKPVARPDPEKQKRDDSGEWLSVAWVEDAQGNPRVLFWFEDEADDFTDYEAQGKILVAPGNKPSFHERRARRLGPLTVRFGGEQNVPDKARENVTAWALAQEILLDWEGMTDEAGDPLPYTPDAGMIALKDYRFRDALVTASATLELRRNAAFGEDAEVLGNGSSGRSRTAKGSSTKRATTTSPKASRGRGRS